jgi:hypothetical protein
MRLSAVLDYSLIVLMIFAVIFAFHTRRYFKDRGEKVSPVAFWQRFNKFEKCFSIFLILVLTLAFALIPFV